MLSLKVDDTGDLVFSGGELRMVSGPEEIAQCCRMILGTNKGEWFLDLDFGIDFSRILGKDVTEEDVRDELTEGMLREPRIQTVDNVDVVFDRAARTVTATITATAINGDIITVEGVEKIVG
ncbi:hypothetical protein PSTEL_00695 [Paenibacillus stellifer]|uniref:DUF2634 domain-containing protein n=1 Tax=Paenibacillus stellifer TaxID=169760 RepID=A0A089LRP6_9BACL|nr:DUF2634 domain-containing protein [Paenibacillus stellifer]AIQ61863.1 hypothetical protein PSTEL_00695 [Paenibacillus stellifer]